MIKWHLDWKVLLYERPFQHRASSLSYIVPCTQHIIYSLIIIHFLTCVYFLSSSHPFMSSALLLGESCCTSDLSWAPQRTLSGHSLPRWQLRGHCHSIFITTPLEASSSSVPSVGIGSGNSPLLVFMRIQLLVLSACQFRLHPLGREPFWSGILGFPWFIHWFSLFFWRFNASLLWKYWVNPL